MNIPFYLTGGTALSRFYLNHRYSEDLDLFVNNDDNYAIYVQDIFRALELSAKKSNFTLDYDNVIRGEQYTQMILRTNEDITLKLDLINDVAKRFGKLQSHSVLGKIDDWRNILSNKLTALYRMEVKDYVDVWAISNSFSFNWKTMLREAREKEAGLDPVMLVELLKSMPATVLNTIKWVETIPSGKLLRDMNIIADDILSGSDNSLHKSVTPGSKN